MHKFILTALLLSFICFRTNAQHFTSSDHVIGMEPTSGINDLPEVKSLRFELLEKGDLVLFSWKRPIESEQNTTMWYEFILMDGKDQLYAKVINVEEHFLDLNAIPHFNYGQSYEIFVNVLLVNNTSSTRVSGRKNSISFKIEPKCVPPSNVQVYQTGAKSLGLKWGGQKPQPGKYEYKITYFLKGEENVAETIIVNQGENEWQLDKLLGGLPYEIIVTRRCYLNDGSFLESDPVKVEGTPGLQQDLANCGQPFVDPTCTTSAPPLTAINFKNLTIKGFLLTEVSLTYNATTLRYSGTANMHLPFQGKKVKVNIDARTISVERVICDGEVEGISDAPAYWPNFFPPQSQFNEICLPSSSSVGFNENGLWMPDSLPWNPQGFGPDSMYVIQPPYPGYYPGAPFDTSGLYDPWGFDASCTNITTGTEFDPNGCSCYETDIFGQPCTHTVSPYYWLNGNDSLGGPTLSGLEFAAEHQTAINNQIVSTLNAQNLQIQILLDSIGGQCDSIRQIMLSLIGALNYDTAIIAGANHEYFDEGLSNNFLFELTPGTQLDRNAQTVQLENEHINLYSCDKSAEVQRRYKMVIDYFLSPDGMDSLKTVIIALVERFTPEETEYYSNPDTLAGWVKLRVIEQIKAKYTALFGFSTSSIEMAPKTQHSRFGEAPSSRGAGQRKPLQKMQQVFSEGGLLAAVGNNTELLLQSMSPTSKELAWYYAQGFEEIYGVDRGFFIDQIAAERRKSALFPEDFTAHDTLLQPIEIPKWVGGQYYYIYLDKIKVKHKLLDGGAYDSQATLDAYAILNVPVLDQKVVFKADNIHFTPNGPDIVPIQLKLNNDVGIRMGNAVKMIIKKHDATHPTFIQADCDGFLGISIAGEVELCRNVVVPLNPATFDVIPTPARVSGSFLISLTNWHDFFLTVDMDPFAVAGYEDYKWNISQVVVDFSDLQSPTGPIPDGYNTPFANSTMGFSNLWKGVYIQDFELLLPKQFSKNGVHSSVEVNSVVIDERGFSGNVSATTPLIQLNEGSASGWAFSVDNLQLTFLANQLAYGGFGGKINVPIFKNQNSCNPNAPVNAADCFNYNANILPSNAYNMIVSMPSGQTFCADLWKAGSVALNPNSTIKIEVVNQEFVATANLSGSIVLEGQIGGVELNVPDNIQFQNVVIRSKAPYFSVGTWSMPSSVNCQFNGFGLTVKDLGVKPGASADEYYLNLGIDISLTKEGGSSDQDELGITAGANLKVLGRLTTVDDRQRWKFHEIQVSAISIDATFPGGSIKGALITYDDTDPNGWGKGFRGIVDAKFGSGKLMQTQIKALAHFGKKPGTAGFKYFFVDALVVLPSSVPLFPPLQLHGIGGGAFYHMTRSSMNGGLPPGPTGDTFLPGSLGVSLSGIQYVPDITTSLGVKLTVVTALPKETAFNASLTLEMEFNSKSEGGGIKKCALDGTAIFMKDLDVSTSPDTLQTLSNPATFKAEAHIAVTFGQNFSLHGVLVTYLDVAGKITGEGPNGQMALTEMHIEPGNWYINIGTPNSPAGLKFKLGSSNLASVRAYMDIGKNIPPMPPLPAAVQAMTGMGNFMANESMRATGNGFAFGASIKIGDGEKKYVPDNNSNLYFYAYLNAQAGFDLMLQDYGDAACSNLGGQELGINGWYASGQAYALLQSALGVGFDLWGIRKEIDIVHLGAAAALQMKLPNPFWAKGAVGGQFSVLGGLVKGKVNFSFTVGESCEISGGENPEDNLLIINEIDPINGSTHVDVFTQPTVSFNLPIGATFQTSSVYGSVEYKTVLEYVEISHNGTLLAAEPTWEDGNTFLKLIPQTMLPSNDSVTIEVKVRVFRNSIEVAPEIKAVTFFTGDQYEAIPSFNVKAAYPFNGQYNFYKNEWSQQKGFIMLHAGQPELFQPQEGVSILAVITPQTGLAFESPVSYTSQQAMVSFPLPASGLSPQTIYKIEIEKKFVDANQSSQNNQSRFLPGGNLSNNQVRCILYTAYFRTSEYPTFYEKVTALFSPPQGQLVSGDQGQFDVPIPGTEHFDFFEIGGYGNFELVQLTALLDETPWYNNHMKPLIYNEFGQIFPGQHGIWINQRPFETIGRIPYKAVGLIDESNAGNLQISAGDFEAGAAPSSNVTQYINYRVPYITNADWFEVCNDAYDYISKSCSQNPNCVSCAQETCCAYTGESNCSVNCNAFLTMEDYVEFFLDYHFPEEHLKNLYKRVGYVPPSSGNYPVEISYSIPGINVKTSSKKIVLVK